MTRPTLHVGPDAIALDWAGAPARYPLLWLRDNAPEAFHPQTRERVQDLLSLPEQPGIDGAELTDDALHVRWTDAAPSTYPLAWLADRRPGHRAPDAADIPAETWDNGLDLPRHDAGAILSDDAALRAWMRDTRRLGLTIVEGLADAAGAGVALAERIGFLRRTNFGTTFEVISKPDPNNLAYTAEALPLHTDLANQEVPPGYQFLHCIANAAEGGGSLFADGFAMAEVLRRDAPEAFRLLSETAVPFRFHDGETDLRVHRPVITLDPAGTVIEIRWNAHLADIFDMPAAEMAAYYAAYRAYMALTREARFTLSLKLRGGEMVAFDNRRVLHGRGAFDPSTGHRHLQGCYVDRGEFDARLRLLG